IAKAMDRTTKQVTNKAFRLGLRRKTKPCDLALPVQQVAKRPARHAAPKATGRSVPAQTVAERLDALGNGKLWTPQKDLILALSFVRGDSAAKIAGAMALDAGDVTARWQALCPNRNHKAAINALVRELKVRANV
ncbi:MAG: hypothetical protein KKB02_15990, partial [Alphaproteobacteria bacterium]|nr:hypothetical protein [Alphaproteobacteria bacterium]